MAHDENRAKFLKDGMLVSGAAACKAGGSDLICCNGIRRRKYGRPPSKNTRSSRYRLQMESRSCFDRMVLMRSKR